VRRQVVEFGVVVKLGLEVEAEVVVGRAVDIGVGWIGLKSVGPAIDIRVSYLYLKTQILSFSHPVDSRQTRFQQQK